MGPEVRFGIAYGILEILISRGRAVRPTGWLAGLEFWFVTIAVMTWAIVAEDPRM